MEGRSNGLNCFKFKDVNSSRHKETAAADGNSGEQIETDPEAPWIGIAEIADGTDPDRIADHGNDEGDPHQGQQDQ